MKDGTGAGEPAEVSRLELYDAYVRCYRQLSTVVGPCRDSSLLSRAAQYLLTEPQPGGAFTVFPFYEAVSPSPESRVTDCRKHLWAFIKATELLETLCVNLFLQPWKKEIKTVKTFTGPFVYCLLPVLSNSTIKSVLASIGYLPHTDTPSEFRLSEDAKPDTAMQVGFELLLARVECFNLLELLDKDQLEPQEWMDVLQRRVRPTKSEGPTEKNATIEPKEEEKMKKEEIDRKEAPLYLDTRLVVHPQPKTWRHNFSADQSIMEMQRTYPDLAIRGHPLVLDKPHQANSSRSSSSKHVRTASDDDGVAELPKQDSRAAATTLCRKNHGSKVDEVLGSNSCNDSNNGGTGPPGSITSSSTDGSRVDDELSGPQAISLHITLRTGSKSEKSLKPGEPQPPAEAPGWMQQQATADVQNKKPDLSSLSSADEDQDLRDLAERMGQLHVQEIKEEMNRKEETRRGEENKSKERRKKGRKTSTQGESEDQNLMKPVMETGPAVSNDTSRCTRSSQSAHAVMKQQKQATVCHPSPLNITTANYESCKGGGSTGQQEGEEAGRAETGQGEEEHLAQSFVIVEHHKK